MAKKDDDRVVRDNRGRDVHVRSGSGSSSQAGLASLRNSPTKNPPADPKKGSKRS